ncbi:hypothetical protein VSX64_25270 [Aurantimonas sp. C2-6-R+9]|uniref:hypothetical protein n=1 Tax=unclassified Aurantimonas TaxID=2638230 RepID=UPI002E178351|nr:MULTISPECIES: hypothetical protein [unclassified Aurantimonas]MEC5293571.1 hypothetical protein [Aurantimonas sp. C2-3-R2]MEC5383995.1 hypothetical protein [Aurantimonas sp. C2-6-R+9]MEC5414642.1 hypothetical protein [Aurantimonas sp. C2-4-R8]
MTDIAFEPDEIVLEIGVSDGKNYDNLTAAGFGPMPAEEREGDPVRHSSMLQCRLRKSISIATVEAIQEYLATFGSGRASLRTINETVFLQPRTQLDVDLLCSEAGQFVTGWRAEQ